MRKGVNPGFEGPVRLGAPLTVRLGDNFPAPDFPLPELKVHLKKPHQFS